MKRLVELHSKSQYPSFYLSDQTCNYSVKLTPLVNANSLYIVISHKKELLTKRKKSKYKIAFYTISEVMSPKDMKDKCNPRKRSIIGV